VANWRKEIEKSYDKHVRYVLKHHGFKKIHGVGRLNYPYDYTAEKQGLTCFIELKVRSPQAKTQFFCFRESKIKALKKLNQSAPVYILLINKYGYKLAELDDFLLKKNGIYGFNYAVAHNKKVVAWYFTPLGWRGKTKKPKQTEKVMLTLTPELKNKIIIEVKKKYGDRRGALAMFVESALREKLNLPKLERTENNSALVYR